MDKLAQIVSIRITEDDLEFIDAEIEQQNRCGSNWNRSFWLRSMLHSMRVARGQDQSIHGKHCMRQEVPECHQVCRK